MNSTNNSTNKIKVLLCALNSQYVHTNTAVRYIKAYADSHCQNALCEIYENNVNSKPETLFHEITEKTPDVYAFSCYIWNIQTVVPLCEHIKNNNPQAVIILGGPEVSFNPAYYLKNGIADYVQCGDGEKPMSALFDAIALGISVPEDFGICYKHNGETVLSVPYYERNLTELESPYTDEYTSALNGRIAYIESSRGCPFSCAFCLSGSQRSVRYFDMEYVKKSILTLASSGAKTVKFVDRTFNADSNRAEQIISFIIENRHTMPHDICFHFEVAADILKESTICLLESAPAGLFQIEAGLQSFNEETLCSVMRKTDTEKIALNVRRIAQKGNIHTHIDLIAGLPYEDFESFKKSFDEAYSIDAHKLQLGFLKLIYGSALREKIKDYGFVFSQEPPYEVRSTKWISENEMRFLKDAEDACEKISNSGRFKRSLKYVLEKTGISPFELFLGFGKKESMPLDEYTGLVLEYFCSFDGIDHAQVRDLMCCDRLASNSSGRLPECLKIADKRLARITYLLSLRPETAPPPNTKRALCILYSQNRAVYADYPVNGNKKNEYELKYINLDVLKEEKLYE